MPPSAFAWIGQGSTGPVGPRRRAAAKATATNARATKSARCGGCHGRDNVCDHGGGGNLGEKCVFVRARVFVYVSYGGQFAKKMI